MYKQQNVFKCNLIFKDPTITSIATEKLPKKKRLGKEEISGSVVVK